MTNVHLGPGDFASGRNIDRHYITVLGSCVSVVLWHPTSRFFAMCHYVNVHTNKGALLAPRLQGHYAELILPHFLRIIKKHGLAAADILASVVGGASSQATHKLSQQFQVGQRNLEFARQFIQQQGFALALEDMGGEFGRKLEFYSATGQCVVTPLRQKVANELNKK